jgi:asparagine synthase (glutamine-hydrolysing)
MCGIAGTFVTDRSERVDPAVLRAMNRAQAHRGPDHDGIYCGDFVGLAARRLAIIDPAHGDQPISNADDTSWIVFNGEIYNHRALRAELERASIPFKTRTDTEVILHLYDRLGERCVERLEGMFAFAVWDARRSRLFVARDRLGIKPLFYSFDGRAFHFASEIKALLAQPGRRAALSREGLAEYLFCGMTLGPSTFFQGIHALPPGHHLTVTPDGVRVRAYWDVPFAPREDASEAACADELFAILSDAVARELHADAPLGGCLSGGLDSSVVATLAARQRPGFPTFSIGYARNSEVFERAPRRIVGEVVGDDWHYAHVMAEALGTDHHAYRLPVEPLVEAIDRMIWHREKPLVTLSEYGHHRLSREAGREVKVLLSGQGSDELFGGYYYWFQRRGAENTTFFPWVFRTDPADPAYPSTEVDWFEHLLTDDARRAVPFEAHQATFDALMARADTPDFFNKISYLLLKTHLHEMLELEDRHGMTHSVEMRVPFLDHRLATWALNLPAAVKVSRREEKRLLRRMVQTHLPEFPVAVLARRKSPMPPPFDIRAPVAAMLDALGRPGLAVEAYFDGGRLRHFLRSFDPARLDVISQKHYVLFALYFLERWHHLFEQAAGRVPPATNGASATLDGQQSTVLS